MRERERERERVAALKHGSSFAEEFKNVARYRSENNFVGSSK